VKIRYFSIFFLFLQSGAFAQTSLVELVKNFTETNAALEKGLNSPDQECPTSSTDFSMIQAKTAVVIDGDRSFEVSVVDENIVQSLFIQLANQPHIPFKYPEGGCNSKAHEMSRLLEKFGIITGKAFIEGKLRVETLNGPKGYVEWGYHVAPFLYVEKQGRLEIYVLDPSIFNKAVPLKEWQKIQVKHKNGLITDKYLTKRFNYNIFQKDEDLSSWNENQIKDSDELNAAYLKVQEQRLKEIQHSKND
jgi:hypothetical protein